MHNLPLINHSDIELDSPINQKLCYIDSLSTVYSGNTLNAKLIFKYLNEIKTLLDRKQIDLSGIDIDSQGVIKIKEDLVLPEGTCHILVQFLSDDIEVSKNDPTLYYNYYLR